MLLHHLGINATLLALSKQVGAWENTGYTLYGL
jgi:hypothetical protein